MAQRGTAIGLALLFAVGCADSEPTCNDCGGQGSAAIGGGGAGGAGSGGDSGAGGMSGLRACQDVRPTIGACVQGEDGFAEEIVSMNGVVEAIEQPGPATCSRYAIGAVEGAGEEQRYDLVIRDDEATIRVAVRLPWSKPIVNVGDVVSVAFRGQWPTFGIASGNVTLRDAEGGLLFSATQSGNGFGGIAVPGMSIVDVEHVCSSDELSDCGVSTHGDIRVLHQSEEVTIGYGERAEVGEYVVLHGDNTRFTVPVFACTDVSDYHRVVVAVVRGSEASLNQQDEDAGL